eukprot:3688875-Rhodomonas_salina.4
MLLLQRRHRPRSPQRSPSASLPELCACHLARPERQILKAHLKPNGSSRPRQLMWTPKVCSRKQKRLQFAAGELVDERLERVSRVARTPENTDMGSPCALSWLGNDSAFPDRLPHVCGPRNGCVEFLLLGPIISVDTPSAPNHGRDPTADTRTLRSLTLKSQEHSRVCVVLRPCAVRRWRILACSGFRSPLDVSIAPRQTPLRLHPASVARDRAIEAARRESPPLFEQGPASGIPQDPAHSVSRREQHSAASSSTRGVSTVREKGRPELAARERVDERFQRVSRRSRAVEKPDRVLPPALSRVGPELIPPAFDFLPHRLRPAEVCPVASLAGTTPARDAPW